ncbi:hypothetical protein G6F65_017916 [Rhizopus arrhizus]|nr:hypothetical protein G6F65_017916 [Rhizopus arrhizus]
MDDVTQQNAALVEQAAAAAASLEDQAQRLAATAAFFKVPAETIIDMTAEPAPVALRPAYAADLRRLKSWPARPLSRGKAPFIPAPPAHPTMSRPTYELRTRLYVLPIHAGPRRAAAGQERRRHLQALRGPVRRVVRGKGLAHGRHITGATRRAFGRKPAGAGAERIPRRARPRLRAEPA